MQEVLDPVLRNLAFGEKNAITLFPEGGAYNFFIGAVSAGVMNSVSYTSGAIADRKNVNYDITLPSGTVVTSDAINNVMNARESDADRLLLAKLGEEMTPELLEREVSKIQSRANVDMGGRTYGDVMKEAAGLETSAERIDLYSDIINSEEYAASVEAYKQSGAQHSIERNVKGLYVQADRKVLHGDDPVQWESQLENFINDKIRKGEDFKFLTRDGKDVLTITKDTAWKMKHRNVVNFPKIGKVPISDSAFKAKLNAAGHVDEIASISKKISEKENKGNKRHGTLSDVKKFDYRHAYFMDNDGQYYRVIISVAKSSNSGDVIYNIGRMEKVPFPVRGSKAQGIKPHIGNETFLDNKIPQQDQNVKQKDSFEKGKDVIRHLTAARMAAEYGLQVKIIDNPNKDVHGYVSGDTVYLNRNSDKSILVTMVHELTHKTENTKFYKEIHTAAINWMHQTGVDMSAFRDRIAEIYAENGIELSDSGIDYEITAKFIADVVFGTEAEVFNFVHRNQSLAQKIKGWIDTLLGRSPEDVNLKIAKRNFEKALMEVRRQTSTDNADVQYYIAKDDKGNDISVIEQNIFAGKKGIPQHIVVADHIREHIGEVYSIMQDASAVYLGADLPGEYTQSKYTQVLKKAKDSRIRGKNQAVQNLGELIEIGRNMRWEANKKPKHKQDAKYGWYRYDTSFAVPVRDIKQNLLHYNAFDATLLIRHNADGKKYLYDLIDIKKRGKPLTSALLQRSVTVGNQMITSATSFRSTNISQPKQNVNTPKQKNKQDIGRSFTELVKQERLTAKDMRLLSQKDSAQTKTPNPKQSNFAKNMAGQKIISETCTYEALSSKELVFYDGITNKETLKDAQQRLREGGEAEALRWWQTEDAAASHDSVVEGILLMEHYDKMGDYEGVVAIAERPDLKPPINRGRFNKKQYCYLIIMLFFLKFQLVKRTACCRF